MKIFAAWTLFFAILAVCATVAYGGATPVTPSLNEKELTQTFSGYKTAFVLLNPDGSVNTKYNASTCSERLSPCSTFKIVNSLIGLETGELKDLDTTFKWDGKKRQRAEWNHDQTLRSAIKDSVVWYFQKLVGQIGEQRMKEYVAKLHYGNEDTSGPLTSFWINSSLKISANEQAELMRKLANDQLPFSAHSMDTTKEGIRLVETGKGTLYGKTGSSSRKDKLVLGWFVGYVVSDGKSYAFATNVRADDRAWGRKARELTEKTLKQANLL